MNSKLFSIPIINFPVLKVKWIYFQIYSSVILFAVVGSLAIVIFLFMNGVAFLLYF